MSQEWQNWQYDAFITIPIIIYFADNNHVILNSLYICIFNSSTINSTSYKLSNVHKKILSVTHMSSHYSIKSFSYFFLQWLEFLLYILYFCYDWKYDTYSANSYVDDHDHNDELLSKSYSHVHIFSPKSKSCVHIKNS